MNNIKNVIFDFGGILLDLDQQATFSTFSRMLNKEITKENAAQEMGQFLLDFEKGILSNESFIWKIQKLGNGQLQGLEIIKAYNKMLLGIRDEIFPFLQLMKKKYNTILLSNTNAIHIQYVKFKILERDHNVRDWQDYFHHVFYSHELGMRKPDYEIYEWVTKNLGLNPKETIFIDDTRENITAAMECGWHAVQHDPNKKIEEHIDQYIRDCESI